MSIEGECERDPGGDGDDELPRVTFCANCDTFARGVGAVMVAFE
jgi:hypothetical protein